MYRISNRLLALQKIYDLNLVVVWYDEILNDNVKLLEDKYRPPKYHKSKNKPQTHAQKMIGQQVEQAGGNIATIVGYRNYDDIDIQFEDGFILKNISVQRWRKGNILHRNNKK